MRLFLAILICFFLIQHPVSAENRPRIMESLSMPSKILGQEVKYSICLPADYYKGKNSYPVVYLLHGLGDDETSWLEYGRIGQIADEAISQKQIVPMIFVMPQGFRTYYVNDFAGAFRYQDMFVKELIPFIDSLYRTKADKLHRATMGYSMGGFGALILPLKHPESFTACVPLSISVRTNKQYMEEASSEWDNQWGRLFGGIGTTGTDRITDYYKQNSPFHLFSQNDLSSLKELKIYIDNGDDEHTLCRSNEELHILLREKGFPHEFRVRNGGHEFSYWRSALPNGLRFLSDAFQNKPYRGEENSRGRGDDLDETRNPKGRNDETKNEIDRFGFESVAIGKVVCNIYLPKEYIYSTRNYPILYVSGSFQKSEKIRLAKFIDSQIESLILPPMIVAFVPDRDELLSEDFFVSTEKRFRVRPGFRFRSLLGYEKGGALALKLALVPEKFTACAIFDASFSKNEPDSLLAGKEAKSLKRTWYFVVAPDKGANYRENGNLHMLFRDLDIYHEYRVIEGKGGFTWLLESLHETLLFIADKFHK